MTKASENIRLVQYLRRRLLPLAVGIGLLLTLLGPLTYWLIEHRSLHRVTRIYAEDLAEHFQHLILESPELWKYQPYKFIDITQEFHPDIDVLGFSVLDEKGEPLTQYEYKEGVKTHGREQTFLEDLGITRGTAPIMFNSRRVGTVEIDVSDAPLQRACAILLCFSAFVGAGLALLVYRFPVRIVRRMEGDILKLVDTVERSEEKYRNLVNNIPDVTWTADSSGNTTFVSPNVTGMFGYSPEELCRTGSALWLDRIHSDDRERVRRAFEELFTEGKRFDTEYRIQRKDGQWTWFHSRATETYIESGVTCADGVVMDISARKRAEEALQESEMKFKGLVEESLVGVYIVVGGIFSYVNPKLADIFGWTFEELVGRKGPADLVLPEDWPTVEQNLQRRINDEIKSINYEFRGVTKDHREIFLEAFGSRTIYQGQPAVIGTLLDITERRQAEEEVNRLNEELQTLYRISLATSRSIEMDQLLADILHSLQETEILPFEIKGSIFLRDGEMLRLASTLSLSEQAVEPCRDIRLGECLCGLAAASGELVISSDSLVDGRHTRCMPGVDVHGHLVIPLKAAGRVVGVLNLFASPGFMVNEHQLNLFSAIGSQVGVAINNVRLFEESRSVSYHDPLTGLANRRFMEIQLIKCFDAAHRYGEMIAIIMADIDHFKAYNDSHGHQEGDRLLMKVAAILVRETRDADFVFRYGGEEFLLLLPWTDAAAACATAERVRTAVEGELGVTISLGAVSCQQGMTDKESLIHLADEALYRAKQNGRNRVEAGG